MQKRSAKGIQKVSGCFSKQPEKQNCGDNFRHSFGRSYARAFCQPGFLRQLNFKDAKNSPKKLISKKLDNLQSCEN